jgi:hypothetical protein
MTNNLSEQKVFRTLDGLDDDWMTQAPARGREVQGPTTGIESQGITID